MIITGRAGRANLLVRAVDGDLGTHRHAYLQNSASSIVGVKGFLNRRQQRPTSQAHKSSRDKRVLIVLPLIGVVDADCCSVLHLTVVCRLNPDSAGIVRERGWKRGPVIIAGRWDVVASCQIRRSGADILELRQGHRCVYAIVGFTKVVSSYKEVGVGGDL